MRVQRASVTLKLGPVFFSLFDLSGVFKVDARLLSASRVEGLIELLSSCSLTMSKREEHSIDVYRD